VGDVLGGRSKRLDSAGPFRLEPRSIWVETGPSLRVRNSATKPGNRTLVSVVYSCDFCDLKSDKTAYIEFSRVNGLHSSVRVLLTRVWYLDSRWVFDIAPHSREIRVAVTDAVVGASACCGAKSDDEFVGCGCVVD
jgi:hypothetical protein